VEVAYFACLLATLFALSGCLVGGLEKTTIETRDEVRATKEGTQTATALEICLDSHVSKSARVAGCKPALLKLPEDRLADYLGIPQRVMSEDSVKRTYHGIELDLPNVLYVGDQMEYELELAPTSADLYEALRMATLHLLSDIGLKVMKPGITAEEMETYRGYGKRMIFVGTAILGAVELNGLSASLKQMGGEFRSEKLGIGQFQFDANRLIGSLEKISPESERTYAAGKMLDMVRNLGLEEEALLTAQRLQEMRTGVRLQ
jgi:hypothetical protein